LSKAQLCRKTKVFLASLPATRTTGKAWGMVLYFPMISLRIVTGGDFLASDI